MFNVYHDEDFVRLKMSSEIRNVKSAIGGARNFLKQYGVRDDSSIVLVLRELLNNALEHGNKKIPDLKVVASIERIGRLRFRIEVEDEGSGFDHGGLDLMLPDDPSQIRNRGLSLVNSFCDQLEFNDKGNRVTVFVTIKPETEFQEELVTSNGMEWRVIRPTGDITAGNAEEFRVALLDLFKTGCRRYRFDLANVEDIDSVALSIFVIFANMARKKFTDAELEIVNASSDIVNLIRMTNLDTIYRLS